MVKTVDKFSLKRNNTIFSKFLNREITFDLIIPNTRKKSKKNPTLYMNDGQELDKLAPMQMLRRYYENGNAPFVWVSIHTNERRQQEYGTSFIADYKNRGALATDYMSFVLIELMPLVQNITNSSPLASDNYFCGFSLGGLSAIDIVWENPFRFSKAGVFSGSFWWRTKSYEEGYEEDLDRIMHNKVKDGEYRENLKFWMECGTNDETEDRNKNGIIDSIDDTLDLIKELKAKGYTDDDITYLEVLGGEHNFNTWQAVFYDFLVWAIN